MSESKVKKLAKLKQKKYRDKYGEFLIEGKKLVDEAIRSKWDIQSLIIDEEQVSKNEVASYELPVYSIDRKSIRKISEVDSFPGIAAIVSITDKSKPIKSNDSIIILDQINDPGNLGTIIRSADWFGVKHIILGPGSVDPYNPKVIRSTMGSFFRVSIHHTDSVMNAIQQYQTDSRKAYATVVKGGAGFASLSSPSILVFGSESHGLSKEVIATCRETLTIPKKGKAESLNLAMSVSIILSHQG